jgi:hypothetical protein|eukprot:COSAG06_NODE_209_length_20178_cov_4.309478_2_plen_74_part_00
MGGDEQLPRDDEGNEAVRQVAQFVALRDVAGNPTALAAKLLQELPGQMLDWFGTFTYTYCLRKPSRYRYRCYY